MMFCFFYPNLSHNIRLEHILCLEYDNVGPGVFHEILIQPSLQERNILSINVSRDLAWFVLNSESAGIQSRFARSSWLWHGWGHGKLKTLSLPEVEVAEGGDASDDNTGCDHSHGISAHLQSPPSRQIIKTGPSWAESYLPVEESLQIS